MELNEFHLNITIVLIILNVVLSVGAFGSQKIMDDLIFYPPAISKRNQWYRFITCGFIHADVFHLLFNMYALYMFGGAVEEAYTSPVLFGDNGKILYIVLYISALIIALLPTYLKNTDNYYYKSLGASGAVAAVVFVYIMLAPGSLLGLVIIPGLKFPAFLFGIIYLIVSAYLDKRGGGNINHSAHFWGSLYGVIFIIVASYFLAHLNVAERFVEQVKEWISSF